MARAPKYIPYCRTWCYHDLPSCQLPAFLCAGYTRGSGPDTIPAIQYMKSVWIRIGFNADPDTAIYLKGDPDQESQTNADSYGYRSWSNVNVTKGWNFTWKYTVGHRSKTYTYECTTAFMKGRKPSSFVNCGQFLCSWIRIRIPIQIRINADTCGSGSTILSRKQKLCPVHRKFWILSKWLKSASG